MAEMLTEQQNKAVMDRGGDLLVSAAAGSGKTKVLVERLMMCINDASDPANIDDFLIITYTKAAASELRAKIAKALTQRIAQDPGNMRLQQQFQRLYLAKISTVHSFCTDILREFSYLLDLPGDFRMLEEQEELAVRREVLDKVLAEAYESVPEMPDLQAFVDTQGIGRNDGVLPELILKVYDSAKCHMDSEGWLDLCVSDSNVSGLKDAGESVWGKYLIDRLFEALDQHILAVDRAAERCEAAVGLEKMALIMRDIARQLSELRASDTWDEIHCRRDLCFGDLRGAGGKKGADKEVYSAAKTVRDFCMKDIKSLLEDFGNDSSRVISDLESVLPAVRGLVDLVKAFSGQYDQLKKAIHVMDFSDLEHRSLDLLLGKARKGPTLIARQIGDRYRQIMVDEYQDSNEVQDAIFSALTKDKNNLFMVGDVKQSIYQFRLADPGIFLGKYAQFASAENALDGQGRKIVLSNNFRSGPEIIEAVNSVFRKTMSADVGGLDYGDDEALWEGVPKERLPDSAVSLCLIDVDSDSYTEEAEYAAQEIAGLLDGSHMIRGKEGLRKIQAEDIAILLRSPKTSGLYFQNALLKRGIRTVSSQSDNMLVSDEVEWLRSLLQVINNPCQDISLLAAVTGPVFGFSADDLASVRAKLPKGCFYDALKVSQLPKAKDFLHKLLKLRRAARLYSLPQLIETIYNVTKADAIYSAMNDGENRNIHLREFYQFVVRYSAQPGADLSQLLRYLEQCDEKGLIVNRQVQTEGCVQIVSIHKSKGLEYPVVFLCGLSRAFNMRSVNGTLLCDSRLGLGLSCIDRKCRIRYPSIANNAISRKLRNDSISEELRVLYVAMTRPCDRLYMTFAGSKIPGLINDLANLIDICPRGLLNSRVTCPGTWVLYTALQRTEAGELFAVGRKPNDTYVSDIPWDIRYIVSQPVESAEIMDAQVDMQKNDGTFSEQLKENLAFQYPYYAATITPSKQTATQIKGRPKDYEAQENAPSNDRVIAQWRSSSKEKKNTGSLDYGNAVHAALQHMDLNDCGCKADIAWQIDKLRQEGRLSEQQADMLDPGKFAAFFESSLGSRLRHAEKALREFKFSILVDAALFDGCVDKEEILVQGVVDCAIFEPDGIVIVDFKTDKITEDNFVQRVDQYRSQIDIYANAIARIFEKPVKEKILYFFYNDTAVSV